MACSGNLECEADTHIHGCFADQGMCDAPEEHKPAEVDLLVVRQNAMLHGNFERSIDSIVRDLRDLADRIERAKKIGPRARLPYLTRDRQPYLSSAQGVVSDIMNCLPNLNLGLLFERAHDAETLMEETSG